MEQLIILVIFGVVALLNWLVRKGASSGGSDLKKLPPFPRGDLPPRRLQPADSEEERLRKFREALGIPTVIDMPKKVARPPQRVPQHVPPIYQREIPKPPALKQAVPPPLAAPPASPWETAATESGKFATVETMPISSTPTVASAPASTAMADFRALLKSPSSLRTAVILREVLGPPKALQTAGGIPGLS